MGSKNYYKILGISSRAAASEIKSAYRTLARKYHPDSTRDDTSAAVFSEVQQAYQLLMDVDKRKEYDFLNPDLVEENAFKPENNEAEQRKTYESEAATSRPWPKFDFSDNPDGGYQGPAAGKFKNAKPDPAEEEASQSNSIFGKIRKSLGRGKPSDDPVKRDSSNPAGSETGEVNNPPPWQARHREFFFSIDALESIKGTSREIAINDGDSPRLIRVKIPAGVQDGSIVKVNVGPGDVVSARIRVVPHPLVDRQGNDLVISLPITISEAAFGTEAYVPTLTGAILVKLPPKGNQEKRLRLKGKGFYNEQEHQQGDLYVKTYIVMPEAIPQEQEEAVKNLSSAYKLDVRRDIPSTLS